MPTNQAYTGKGVRGQLGRIKLLPRSGNQHGPSYRDGLASDSRGGIKVRDGNGGNHKQAG